MNDSRLPIPPTIRELSGIRDQGLIRVWRKNWAVTAFIIFFCIIWNSFLVFWYGAAFLMKDPPMMMLWFPLLHVAVGVGLIYYVLTTIMNRTEFLVDGSTLSVKHRPLYWPGSQSIPKAEISQIFITESRTHNKGRVHLHYTIHWMNQHNRAQKLVGGLTDISEAIYIERKLEQLLGIKNEAVLGSIDTEPQSP